MCTSQSSPKKDKGPLKTSAQIAFSLFKPPFRHQRGYIFDANNKMIADDPGCSVARVRAWGMISYQPVNPEAIQDRLGDLIALALTELWAKDFDSLDLTQVKADIPEVKVNPQFKAGVKAMFDRMMVVAANNWQGNPVTNKLCDAENEIIHRVAEEALEDLSPEDVRTWRELTVVTSQLEAAKFRIRELEALLTKAEDARVKV